MKLSPLKPRKALNKAYLKVKPNRSAIETFKAQLIQLTDSINESQSEEFHKNLITTFLKKTYYDPNHFINTKDRNDLVIHNGPNAQNSVGVILEVKKPTNKLEMVTQQKLNVKAFQELVLYYLRERITHKNLEIKHLIITNIYEWFLFDASVFEKLFAQNKEFVHQFTDFEEKRLSGKTTDFFYKEIAEPFINGISSEVEFVHFHLQDFQKIIRNADKNDDNALIGLFKVLSPEHLLKLPFANDSNTLDKRFYTELLHIIGLTEVKEGSKKLIDRNQPNERHPGTLLENTIIELDSRDKISRLSNSSQYGKNKEEKLFTVGLELTITWINRILFLKLLEAQLIAYHKGDPSYAFLNLLKITNYDNLDALFFKVLARRQEERLPDVKAVFEKIPYLNSSLFEPTDLEHDTLFISNLADDKNIPIHSQTVLKDAQGKKRTGQLSTLEYLFAFLDAYDFSSEGSEEIQEDNKTLINASVLGLIFEKINGYKDGSFFTPGFITMYMCRETIRRAVLQKFREQYGWECESIPELYNKIEDRQAANEVINSLKICDPAVGSGHFLVSALNELIAIKSELRILQDRKGKRLKEYQVEVVNDELIITDEDGDLFEYKPGNAESQRVQEALFHEKQVLIENCLFGVDINPNSVKICRLRLWIELLKNAYYKSANVLETLPNIDINIKCGNSLVSRFPIDADLSQALKKSKWNIHTYRDAVSTYRNAENKEQKRTMEQLIAEIKSDFKSNIDHPFKKKISAARGKVDLLATEINTQKQWGEKIDKQLHKEFEKAAQQLLKLEAERDSIENNVIYENAFEWRFEFPEVLNDEGDFVGFDVVIGNPPYGALFNESEKTFIKSNYDYLDYQFDIYMTFIERSYSLLKKYSQICFILPNTWLLNLKTPNIRKLLFSRFNIHNLRAYNFPVFEEAVVDTIIVCAEMKNDSTGSMIVEIIDKNGNIFLNKFSKKELSLRYKSHLNIYLSEFASKIEFKLSSLLKIGDISKITQGAKPFQKGKGKPKQDEKILQDKPYVQSYKKDETFRPLLRGSLINKYLIAWNNDYFISLGDWLAEPRYSANYNAAVKIVIRQTGSSLVATIDNRQFVVRDNLYTITSSHKDYSEPLILACLNSNLLNWYYQNIVNNEVGEALAQVKKGHLEILPVPKYNRAIFETVVRLTQDILSMKQVNNTADTTALESQIDQLVYELYGLTEEEIQIVEAATR